MDIQKIVQGRLNLHKKEVVAEDFFLIVLTMLLVSVLVAACAEGGILQALRLLAGLIFIVYVPGYCLVAALFPGNDDLTILERFGLSTGTSVALVPVIALLIDRLPWGLRPLPVLLSEDIVSLLFMMIALLRRYSLPDGLAYSPKAAWRLRSWWRLLSPGEKRIYALGIGSLIMAIVAFTWFLLAPSRSSRMTEFYLLGPDGKAESYPGQGVAGQPLQVMMGIHNLEGAEASYRVEARLDDRVIGRAGPWTLKPGGAFEGSLVFTPPDAAKDAQVSILLYKDQQAAPYRNLRLWINVLPE